MSIAITYSSVNGNTQAVAEAIENALIARATFKEVQSGRHCDGISLSEDDCRDRPLYCGPHDDAALVANTILVGCWNDRDNVDAATAAFLSQCHKKQLALFLTSGCCDEAYLKTVWENILKLIGEDNVLIGQIAIQGTLTDEARKRCADFSAFPIQCGNSRHPNDDDMQRAGEWAVSLFE